MTYILSELTQFTPISVVVRILLATLLGGLIGTERGRHGRDAGLRTHIFIALGSAMTSLIGIYTVEILGYGSDPMRIAAQVVSGIGFLGVGTILVKNSSKVTGLTTAAGMWATSAIGIATGIGFYSAAILCTAICLITATLLTKLEVNRRAIRQLYIEIEGVKNANTIIEHLSELSQGKVEINILNAKSSTAGNIGILATLPIASENKHSFIEKILTLDNVVLVAED